MNKVMENMKGNQIAAKHLTNPYTPILFKYYDPFHGLGTIGERNWGYSKEDAVITFPFTTSASTALAERVPKSTPMV